VVEACDVSRVSGVLGRGRPFRGVPRFRNPHSRIPEPCETERAGFEPATHLSARTRFPVALLRPLGHLSRRRRRVAFKPLARAASGEGGEPGTRTRIRRATVARTHLARAGARLAGALRPRPRRPSRPALGAVPAGWRCSRDPAATGSAHTRGSGGACRRTQRVRGAPCASRSPAGGAAGAARFRRTGRRRKHSADARRSNPRSTPGAGRKYIPGSCACAYPCARARAPTVDLATRLDVTQLDKSPTAACARELERPGRAREGPSRDFYDRSTASACADARLRVHGRQGVPPGCRVRPADHPAASRSSVRGNRRAAFDRSWS
jgi:hypothetical protein